MPQTVFMFTDVYPYGPFEQCAGEELGYIAERFDRVVLMPRRRGGHPMVRPTPDNVEVAEPFFPTDGKGDVLAKGLLNRAPCAGSNPSTARIRPTLPSSMRSDSDRPRFAVATGNY